MKKVRPLRKESERLNKKTMGSGYDKTLDSDALTAHWYVFEIRRCPFIGFRFIAGVW